ncbi:hypothetical protein J6590_013586 [Homalodisca vitripennis]|nr:hypothetical protein J6590_013586 [Homalodisca vitripennis]
MNVESKVKHEVRDKVSNKRQFTEQVWGRSGGWNTKCAQQGGRQSLTLIWLHHLLDTGQFVGYNNLSILHGMNVESKVKHEVRDKVSNKRQFTEQVWGRSGGWNTKCAQQGGRQSLTLIWLHHLLDTVGIFATRPFRIGILTPWGTIEDIEAFRKLQLLTLPCLYIFETILFCMSKCALTRGQDIHMYETRGRANYRTGRHRTVVYERLPSQAGVQFLNRLPNSIKHAPTPKALKTRLKRFLVSQAFYNAGQIPPKEVEPEFLAPLENLTVTQGREVTFTCVVNHLGPYKVSYKHINHAVTCNTSLAYYRNEFTQKSHYCLLADGSNNIGKTGSQEISSGFGRKLILLYPQRAQSPLQGSLIEFLVSGFFQSNFLGLSVTSPPDETMRLPLHLFIVDHQNDVEVRFELLRCRLWISSDEPEPRFHVSNLIASDNSR